MKSKGRCSIFLVTVLVCCFAGLSFAGTSTNFVPEPYAQGATWPAQHHDPHNSDWVPLQSRAFMPADHLKTIYWLGSTVSEPDSPSVPMAGGAFTGDKPYSRFFTTRGKVNYPNIEAYDLQNGSRLWQTAPSTFANAPGPDSCVLTCSPTLDDQGLMYISDCHYIYCFPAETNLNGYGYQAWLWRTNMPNLRAYNYGSGQWDATNVVTTNSFARPFLSFQFSRQVGGKAYLLGVTLDGAIYAFDPLDGTLVAEGYLNGEPAHSIDGDEPCNPTNPIPIATFGIWSTGQQTGDPDVDYFMNPCQLAVYLQANTAGTGAKVANTHCVIPDHSRADVSRVYICAEECTPSLPGDVDTNILDSIVYRIDFDPSQAYSNRLVVMNYATNHLGQYLFDGRMTNGVNSATSPDVSPNQKWIFSADKNGIMYCFDADDGHIVWQKNIGTTMGSPTTFQTVDENGWFKFIAFGDYDIRIFEIVADTGMIASNATYGEYYRELNFSDYIVQNWWRDGEGYTNTYYTTVGHNEFIRKAVGASIILSTSNRITSVYSVGWQYPGGLPTNFFPNVRLPDIPALELMLFPTHSLILIVDAEKVWSSPDLAGMIETGYIDTNGTSESGMMFDPNGANRGCMIYGSQSSSMAQHFDQHAIVWTNPISHQTNTISLMPEEMKPYYVKPYGGIRIVELPLAYSSVPLDFDGDGASDIGCYYPPEGWWYLYKSEQGFWVTQYGYTGTRPVAGDFDGDQICDYGVYAQADGAWNIQRSSAGAFSTRFGYDGTVPVVGDFDGDGLADFGCYYAASGYWYVFRSSDQELWTAQFGYAGTVPVVGDFDGDHISDYGVYNAEDGAWSVMRSRDGLFTTKFGYAGTEPIVGDFDGDGMADFGCYHAPDGWWYVFRSSDQQLWTTQFGYGGTDPIVGDYDGDGIGDFGCYYPPQGWWYLFRSSDQQLWTTRFGYSGTLPVQ